MVNTLNISWYEGTPPTDSDADRKIRRKEPLYTPDQVKKILTEGENKLKVWTKKAIQDQQKYCLDTSDILELLELAMQSGTYLGAEWCVQKPTGPWAACDSYRVRRDEWVDAAYKSMKMEYYLKFAVNKSGKLIFTASCHLSEDRY